jgi:DNA invertase Pin-like site-specific DNA recombinase
MKVGIYARVSSDAQQARATIGSQLQTLRDRVAAAGDELIEEFIDDGYSGARLDRPGLDRLRDAAEAGAIDVIWCLSPDRLARSYAYQVLILDEFARYQVPVRFADTPPLDDPQGRLLVQIQGVIAEHERAKFAERGRRGKLYRSRAGEVLATKVPYGYRRIPRNADGAAHLIICEPEAGVVRRIFADFLAGASLRNLAVTLSNEGIASPEGKPVWRLSTICRLLRNEAYAGRLYWNRTQLATTRLWATTGQPSDPDRNGSRSPYPPSSTKPPSTPSPPPPATTAATAPGAPSPTPSCCADCCAAPTARSSSTATGPAAARPQPATTSAPTATPGAPAGPSAAAPNGGYAPTTWTPSSSTSYATCSPAPS